MPYYETLAEDIQRTKQILQARRTVTSRDDVVYKLLESLVAEVERLQRLEELVRHWQTLHGELLRNNPMDKRYTDWNNFASGVRAAADAVRAWQTSDAGHQRHLERD